MANEKDYTKMSETDIAFDILQEQHKPMWYKDLIEEVIKRKQKPIQAVSHTIAEIYTLINMDSRFAYDAIASRTAEGTRSMWGLAIWQSEEKAAEDENN